MALVVVRGRTQGAALCGIAAVAWQLACEDKAQYCKRT